MEFFNKMGRVRVFKDSPKFESLEYPNIFLNIHEVLSLVEKSLEEKNYDKHLLEIQSQLDSINLEIKKIQNDSSLDKFFRDEVLKFKEHYFAQLVPAIEILESQVEGLERVSYYNKNYDIPFEELKKDGQTKIFELNYEGNRIMVPVEYRESIVALSGDSAYEARFLPKGVLEGKDNFSGFHCIFPVSIFSSYSEQEFKKYLEYNFKLTVDSNTSE
ncbi:hypothetical protein CSB37_00195 [bacterium DOLZORAL124_38_8]|nr:MAG: hypothetical protein CSB37_00195 [bacterium DOLZORAL124_38_8]